MYKYTIHTYGCQMNVGDAQWLSRALATRGFTEAVANVDMNTAEPVDLTILYTCSIRDKAEQRVYQIISRLQHIHKDNPKYIIAVGACVAQQLGNALLEKFPAVRVVFGTDGTAQLPSVLEQVMENPSLQISLLDFMDEYPERDFSIAQTNIAPIEYVNIMQGCDNYCTYCIVPFTRGRQKSRKPAEIIKECSLLIEKGVQEIVLLGQNVNAYGLDSKGSISFAELLKEVVDLKGIQRLSFMTPHPKDFDDATVSLFEKKSVLSPRIHLPMQSGSDRILKAMGRQYTIKDYSILVNKLKAVRDDVVFTTDIIVGFPGETEEDFLETLDAMQKIAFAVSFSFCYSDRPGTKASRSLEKVSKEVAMDRLTRLQELQMELSEKYLASYVGSTLAVLLENKIKKQDDDNATIWYGKTIYGNAVKVRLENDINALGETIPVKITSSTRHSLQGVALYK